MGPTQEWAVPVIDISAYVDPDRAAGRAEVAERLDEAARTIGFMQIVGHGVREGTISGLTAAIDGFFGLPLEEKRTLIGPKSINRGYIAPRSESLALSAGIESAGRMNDFFEAFKVGTEASEFPELDLPEDVYAPNPWPTEPSEFRDGINGYLAEAHRVARTLVQIFADALKVPAGTLEGVTDHCLETLQVINYALPEGEVTLDGDLTGMGEHTDFGLVTVLWADPVAGLQVLGDDDRWHDVMPNPGALLVNFGDLISRFTNERWMSTLHRVKPPVIGGRIKRRRSAAFFYDCNYDAVVTTLPSCLADGEEPIYEPVTVAEHVQGKLASLSGAVNTGGAREGARVRRAVESGAG